MADFASGHDVEREALWIADLEGRPAGCVFCVRDAAPDTARLRLLLVDPPARGHGIGRRLVRRCVQFARSAGYRELVLWTNDVLSSARRIHQDVGFELVAEQPHHSFTRTWSARAGASCCGRSRARAGDVGTAGRRPGG